MEKTFTRLNKINTVLSFIFLAGLIAVFLWIFFQSSTFRRRGAVEVVEQTDGKPQKKLLSFSSAENIPGASTLMIRVGYESGSKKYYSGSGGGRDYQTRNLLFIEKQSRKPR